jgi:hypothetical protein
MIGFGRLCDVCYCKQYKVSGFTVTMALTQTYHNTSKKQLKEYLYNEENDIYVIQDFNVDIQKV